MFDFIENLSNPNVDDILLSFFLDIEDCILNNQNPKEILTAYLEEFPQFSTEITDQYKEDEKFNFFIEEEESNKIVPFQDIIVVDIIPIKDIAQDALDKLDELFYRYDMLNQTGGKLFLQIEDRTKYLDKFYLSKKFGFNPKLKDW